MATLPFAIYADLPPQEILSAKDVLAQMAKAYSGCTKYRDFGAVKTKFIAAQRTWTEEKPFTTAFVRPHRFRFEYSESSMLRRKGRYLIWRNGNNVKTWWDIRPGVKKGESLGMALAGATGVSSGAAHTIPALLMPNEIGGRSLSEMTDVSRVADATLGGSECFCIVGKYADEAMTLWIDKQTFLVRQIDEQSKRDHYQTEETTNYTPEIDCEIPDTSLVFDPPSIGERLFDMATSPLEVCSFLLLLSLIIYVRSRQKGGNERSGPRRILVLFFDLGLCGFLWFYVIRW